MLIRVLIQVLGLGLDSFRDFCGWERRLTLYHGLAKRLKDSGVIWDGVNQPNNPPNHKKCVIANSIKYLWKPNPVTYPLIYILYIKISTQIERFFVDFATRCLCSSIWCVFQDLFCSMQKKDDLGDSFGESFSKIWTGLFPLFETRTRGRTLSSLGSLQKKTQVPQKRLGHTTSLLCSTL